MRDSALGKNFLALFESQKVLEKGKTIGTNLLFGLPFTIENKKEKSNMIKII